VVRDGGVGQGAAFLAGADAVACAAPLVGHKAALVIVKTHLIGRRQMRGRRWAHMDQNGWLWVRRGGGDAEWASLGLRVKEPEDKERTAQGCGLESLTNCRIAQDKEWTDLKQGVWGSPRQRMG
jgi:hypothetical protein